MVRGIQPDQVRIRDLRDRLGWTQERLAAESVLSVRVIAKLESGGAVSQTTLEKLAATFARVGEPVGATELAFSAAAVLTRLLRQTTIPQDIRTTAWGAHVAANAALLIPGDKRWMPLAGTHNGTTRIISVWTQFLSMFEHRSFALGQDGQVAITRDGAIAWGQGNLCSQPATPPCLLLVRMLAEAGLIRSLNVYFDEIGVHARLSGSKDRQAR